MPAEGTAGCMSVLLCRRVGGFSTEPRVPLGLGRWDKQFPQCVPHEARAAKPRAVKTLGHFHLRALASARAWVPSDGARPGDSAHVRLRWVWAACVSQEADCVRQRGRWFHRTGARSKAPAAHAVCWPGIRAAMRIDGNRVSARGTGFWKSARQVNLMSIRLLASAGQVCSIRVCGAGLRTSTTGLRSPVPRHFAQ